MKRLSLLLGMLLGMAVLVGTVVFSSPYASPVLPCPENIEDLWAIEDARQESEKPLVAVLSNGGVPLCYDAQENTFYCTLGLECGDEWPQLQLAVLTEGQLTHSVAGKKRKLRKTKDESRQKLRSYTD